jgi:hypothetical protein
MNEKPRRTCRFLFEKEREWGYINNIRILMNKHSFITVILTILLVSVFTVAFAGCEDLTPIEIEHTHEWGPWVQTRAPTTTQEGEETRTCRLDPSHKQTRPVPMLHVHTWGDWTETTAATCTTPGEETRVCALDYSHTETRQTAALGHLWGSWAVTIPATNTQVGIEVRTCKRDPSHTETRAVTATGDTIEGTWVHDLNHPENNEYTFSNSTFTIKEYYPTQKGTYSTSGSRVSMTVTHYYIEPDRADYYNTTEGWKTRSECKDILTEKGANKIESTLDIWFAPFTGSFSGDTLTINEGGFYPGTYHRLR